MTTEKGVLPTWCCGCETAPKAKHHTSSQPKIGPTLEGSGRFCVCWSARQTAIA